MPLKSLLFVPADQPRKLDKAMAGGADALILDLEDSVAPPNKAEARRIAGDYMRAHAGARAVKLWVRINPLASGLALADLAAVVSAGPDGIVLPKPDSAADAAKLCAYLDALEAQAGQPIGRIAILPIATETPRALFTLDSYAEADLGGRLAGLTWGAEDLPAAVGASVNRGEDGAFTDLCRLARSLCVAAAAVAGVAAIETVYPAFRDLEGLACYAAAGRREGFTGMLAIHPDQVAVINEVFTPSAAEVEKAQKIVALFADNPTAGALSLDGRMLDMPHLKQARRVLALAGMG
jgi:citrate lyase subunit beta/citryl-CoA lyase